MTTYYLCRFNKQIFAFENEIPSKYEHFATVEGVTAGLAYADYINKTIKPSTLSVYSIPVGCGIYLLSAEY